jgi:hypothetical protein
VIGGHDKTVRVWDWVKNEVTVLFFEMPILGVSFVAEEPAAFVVADVTGETWGYEICDSNLS